MTKIEGVTIRPLEERDLAALAGELGFSRHHIEARWRERRAGVHATLVAGRADGLAGAVSFEEREIFGDLLHLYALGVVPAARRRGIGARLVEAVEDEAAGRGLAGVYLAVAVDNVAAIRLYQRLGYERVGEPYTSRWTWYGMKGESREVVERCFRMVKRR